MAPVPQIAGRMDPRRAHRLELLQKTAYAVTPPSTRCAPPPCCSRTEEQ